MTRNLIFKCSSDCLPLAYHLLICSRHLSENNVSKIACLCIHGKFLLMVRGINVVICTYHTAISCLIFQNDQCVQVFMNFQEEIYVKTELHFRTFHLDWWWNSRLSPADLATKCDWLKRTSLLIRVIHGNCKINISERKIDLIITNLSWLEYTDFLNLGFCVWNEPYLALRVHVYECPGSIPKAVRIDDLKL